MKKKLIPVTILKRFWLRGGRNNKDKRRNSTLRNKDGEMCCLGFVCLAAGLSKKEILEQSQPASLDRRIKGLAVKSGGWLVNTIITEDMMKVNDAKDILESDRIQRLTSLAKKAGYLFTFK